MEIEIVLGPGVALIQMGFGVAEDAQDGGEIGGGGLQRGFGGDGRFQHAAGFHQLQQGGILQRDGVPVPRIRGAAHEAALAGDGFDEAQQLQHAEGFPERTSAHAKIIHQTAFGGQRIARLQFAAADGCLEFFHYTLVDPGAA